MENILKKQTVCEKNSKTFFYDYLCVKILRCSLFCILLFY